MKNPVSIPFPALLTGLTLTFLWSCSGGGGGGGGAPGFLEIETQVDSSNAADSIEPELHADGNRLFVLFADGRNGADEMFLNRSDDGGRSWLAQDVRIPGDPNGPLGVDYSVQNLAIAGDDLVAAFEESDDLYVNVSHDGGLTWKVSATRLDPGAVNAQDSDDPKVLHDAGNFYVVWEDEINGNNMDDVYFVRSTDLGETWSAPERLNTNAAGSSLSDDIRMTVASTGAIYVVWQDDRDDVGVSRNIRFTRSDDAGVTWLNADLQVDEGLGDSSDPVVAANGATVYVAFLDKRSGDEAVYFQRSVDAGTTWAAMDVRLDTTTPGILAEDLVLEADGDLVMVGWKTSDPGPGDDLFVNVSADGGATWLPAPMRMDLDAPGSGDSDDLHLAVMGQTLFAAWEDDRNGLDDIYLRYSVDGGATWSNEMFVEETTPGSDDASRPTVALSADGAWTAWQDDRNGSLDVFVNGGELPVVP